MARRMCCGVAEAVLLEMGEGGRNCMLLSVNTVITLQLDDTPHGVGIWCRF